MSLAPIPSMPSRRLTARLDAREEVWVYWECNDRDDVSRVRDLSSGGLFIETPRSIPAATLVTLHFLVGEGQVRAEALVRHVERKNGLGLKFLTVTEGDRPKLEALLMRLQGLTRSSASQMRLIHPEARSAPS